MRRVVFVMLACMWPAEVGMAQETAPPAPAAKPKTIAKEYVFTVVLAKAGEDGVVEEASVRLSYGGQAQTKPAKEGRATFKFKTDATEAVVLVNAPGWAIHSKKVPLSQEKVEYRAVLDPSE